MKFIFSKKFFLFLTIVVLVIAGFIYYFMTNIYTSSKASAVNVLDSASLAEGSTVQQDTETTDYDLYKQQGYLYKSNSEGDGAVVDFLAKSPQFAQQQSVKRGFSLLSQEATPPSGKKLIPDNFIQNSALVRKEDDREDPYLQERGIQLNTQHYFYNQKIQNVPVYGANLAVHLKNSKEVYSVEGNLVLDQTLENETLTEEQARNIVIELAKKDLTSTKITVLKSEKYIFNKKILKIEDNDKNYITQMVEIGVEHAGIPYAIPYKRYFVDLSSGQVLYSQDLIHTAMNRMVQDSRYCTNEDDPASCQVLRSEGGVETSDRQANIYYETMGEFYNYFQRTYGRDSYDSRGSIMRSLIHYQGSSNFRCPNAAWAGDFVLACEGLAYKDVIGHEFMHAVTGATADLFYANQSGALNESVSDIFAYQFDPDWTLGEEDQSSGFLRSMEDPTLSRPIPLPDRLFSQFYFCGTEDQGGVHENSGVMNKAFYLMTQGGSFNGCTIRGLGKEKTLPIIYKALTTYLTWTSNFKDMYNKLIRSCSELYPNEVSTTCEEVKKALQATEMDQQPDNSSQSPMCNNGTAVTPQCASLAAATNTPTPNATNTPVPNATNTPVPNATNTPVPNATNTPVPPTNTPTPVNNTTLNLKIKFQGISRKPATASLPVKVTVSGGNLANSLTQTVTFNANDDGTWSGTMVSEQILDGSNFKILVKGPKHVQKRVCVNIPQDKENSPGSYSCSEGTIRITRGINNFDFSGILLLVGDLPEQDGITNSYDTSLILNNLNKTDTTSLQLADLNLDGVVNAQDYSLILAALGVRSDEN